MIIEIKNQDQMIDFANKLASLCKAGDVIALNGDLGVGKSFFSRAFIRYLCGEDEEVPSPTFTLLQTYEGGGAEIYHFDMYRLESPDECLELGVEEAFQEGICLVEWAEKIKPYLPWDCLKMTIEQAKEGGQTRQITLDASQKWASRLEGINK